MNAHLILIILFFFLAIMSFFLSLSETAIIALSKIRLHHMVSKGLKHAQSIQNLVTKMDSFIAAILIVNNFVNIAMSAIITGIFIQMLGYNLGVLLATFTAALFILIICEVTPKILATKNPEKTALLVAPAMEGLLKILNPVVPFFTGVSTFILRLLRIQPSRRSPLITEEELRLMIEVGKEEGVLSDEERKMLHRIFEFGDTKLDSVMVPKDKIIAINVNSNPEELLNIFVEEGHARLPVYQESIDNIVGIIYARDLLYVLRDKALFMLQDLIREAYYAPVSMRVNELLGKFQAEKIQMAVIVDAHKKVLGVVTLEDLIEEIVGEIEEKHTAGRVSKKH